MASTMSPTGFREAVGVDFCSIQHALAAVTPIAEIQFNRRLRAVLTLRTMSTFFFFFFGGGVV